MDSFTAYLTHSRDRKKERCVPFLKIINCFSSESFFFNFGNYNCWHTRTNTIPWAKSLKWVREREKKIIIQLLCWKMWMCVFGSINYVDDKMRWQNCLGNKWWGVAVCRNVLNTNWTQIMLMALSLFLTIYGSLFARYRSLGIEWPWWKARCYVFDGLFTKLMNKLLRAFNFFLFFFFFSFLVYFFVSHSTQYDNVSNHFSIHGHTIVVCELIEVDTFFFSYSIFGFSQLVD